MIYGWKYIRWRILCLAAIAPLAACQTVAEWRDAVYGDDEENVPAARSVYPELPEDHHVTCKRTLMDIVCYRKEPPVYVPREQPSSPTQRSSVPRKDADALTPKP